MYTLPTGLGQAVRDVDLQQPDDIVRRLQPIEARLGQDLQRCQVETDVVTNPNGSAPPEPEHAAANSLRDMVSRSP